jgi:hypothetical protein
VFGGEGGKTKELLTEGDGSARSIFDLRSVFTEVVVRGIGVGAVD